MKNKIIRCFRGDKNYKVQFIIRSDEDAYNSFPCQLNLLILFATIAFIQKEWNLISVLSVGCVAVNLSIIFYRLGYQDMKRQTEINNIGDKYHA